MDRVDFDFSGRLGSSKSIVNRVLIATSFFPNLEIYHNSYSDDVRRLTDSLRQFAQGETTFDCGAGGTTFRFLCVRLSREVGTFKVYGTSRLLQRPQQGLIDLLAQLGTRVQVYADHFELHATGWKDTAHVTVDGSQSSQFVSAVLLSAWKLPQPLRIQLTGEQVSSKYIDLTLGVLQALGMHVVYSSTYLMIKAQQTCQLESYFVEPDLSSVFTLATMAAVCGSAEVYGGRDNIIGGSMQPDIFGFELLRQAGAQVRFESEFLKVIKARALRPIEASLASTPDLFPVLSVVCALAQGTSKLNGARQLRLKETDRLAWTAAFLRSLGRQVEEFDDGLIIHGRPGGTDVADITISCDQDHRAVMAAAIARAVGFPVQVTDAEHISKSFPEFWWCLRRGGWSKSQIRSFHPGFEITPTWGDQVALIGHRGVGKSTYLNGMSARLLGAGILPVDLDHEIAMMELEPTSKYFRRVGETVFRKTEVETFEKVSLLSPCWVSLGAGFDMSKLNRYWWKVWLRRDSDRRGRIFFGRPRLEKDMGPLQEFRLRASARVFYFLKMNDESRWLQEGEELPEHEPFGKFDLSGASLTLRWPDSDTLFSQGLSFEDWLKRWWARRMDSKLKWIELRDDLLTAEQIMTCHRILPDAPFLISHRDAVSRESTRDLMKRYHSIVDWPADVELPPGVQAEIRSLHGDFDEKLLPRFRSEAITKVALKTQNFSQLMKGHIWAKEDPAKRAFLPISADGKWKWYRLWMLNRAPVQFLRENEREVLDQPTAIEWDLGLTYQNPTEFAAVLGSPVDLSRTPVEQRNFFRPKNRPVFAIDIPSEEWPVAIESLKEMGLRAGAVTAPLKILAHALCVERSPEAERLQAVNSLVLKKDRWMGHNTDILGLRAALQTYRAHWSKKTVAIWGGGGTLSAIREIFPHASHHPVRTPNAAVKRVQVLIWAARPDAPLPVGLQPEFIFDLNYFEHSAAREYALQTGARYESGLQMFKRQAQAQRDWWKSF